MDSYTNKIYQGDTLEILKTLPDECVDCIITSPPYWGLRDYGVDGQIGLEPTIDEYIWKMLRITAELKRVLKKTGVFFLNWGDCYGGSGAGTWKNPPEKINSKEVYHLPYGSNPRRRNGISVPSKCLTLQNYRAIIRMIDEQNWILRNTIIWHKPNHMPSSAKDRFTNAYEPVFMLVKNKKYWFDLDAVRVPHKEISIKRSQYKSGNWSTHQYAVEGLRNNMNKSIHPVGKNPGDVWTIPTQPFPEAHFATFPEKLVEPMIKVGCPQWICKKCGEARTRIIKTEYKWQTKRKTKGKKQSSGGMATIPGHALAEHYTIGWTDCGCNASWRSGVVLDPFAGAGTTLKVARELGRNYIGIELKPDYIKIIEKRLVQQTLPVDN